MAELKSTINIEIDGIQQFLDTTVKVEKELLQIEKVLQKQGFKGNEKELKASAKAYRDAMIKASKDVQQAELKRIDATTKAQKTANSIVSRLTIGRGAAEFAQRLVRGLSDIIEKNKETDRELGKLSTGFDRLKNGAANIGLAFLKLAAGPIVAAITGLEKFASKVFGISFESEKASVSLRKLQEEFNTEIDILKTANITQEERRLLITQINDKYKEYLPNLLTEKSSIEDITKAQIEANKAFDAKINLMAAEETFVDLAKRRLDSLKEIAKIEKELVDLEKKTAFKVGLSGGDKTGGRAAALREEINLEKQKLFTISNEYSTLRTVTKEQGIQFTQLGKLTKTEKEVESSLKKQNEYLREQNDLYNSIAANAGLVSGTIGENFEGFLTPGEEDFIAASKELDKLKKNIDNFKKDTEGSIKAKGSLGTLGSELLGLEVDNKNINKNLTGKKGNIIDTIFDILKKDARKSVVDLSEYLEENLLDGLVLSKDVIDKISGAGGGLFKVFITEGLNEEEADAVFKRVFDSSKTFVENLRALAAEGITSPIFEDLIINQDAIDRVTKEIAIAKAAADKFGKDRAKELEDLEKDLAEKQAKFDEAKLQSTINTNKALYEAIKERNKQSLEQGVLLEEDLLEEYSRRQEFELKAIDASIDAQIKANTLAGDKVTEAQLQVLGELQRQRTDTVTRHLKELEALGEDLTKMLFSQFQVDFTSTADELQTGLDTLNLKIRTATRVLDETFTKFGDKRSEAGEELSKQEIANLNDQIDAIQALELQRYEQELALRVNSFKDFLNQINLESDVKIKLINDFYNKEVELAEDNVDRLNAVNARRPDTPEKVKTSYSEIISTANIVQQAFSDVFSAYVSFQDSVAQKAIDGIQTQLDTVNQAISDTTSNIDALEGDLEGKRSGRREAILRGLAIEQAREEALTEKKIDLERKLRIAEQKASDDRKAAAIAQALINGAVAVTNVWANSTIPYPAQAVFGAIQTAALATITGLQIATIEQQTFADGGMLDGPSHSQGGIPFTINGAPGFEAEGGEAIMSRRTVDMFKPQLHAMQVASGSKGLYAEGGMLGANFGAMNEALSGSSFRQLQMIADKPTYVKVSDIDNLQARQTRVTDITTL